MNLNNVKFTKMHGIGNDFVLLDGLNDKLLGLEYKKLAIKLCKRHFGIGADGLIVILAAENKANDFKMRIFNPDGSEAEMCGNGIRCFLHFLKEKKLIDKSSCRIETLAGIIEPELIENRLDIKMVKVNMGKPRLKAEDIPIAINENIDYVLDYKLKIEGKSIGINCVSMGNPHTVIFTDDLDEYELSYWGKKIENHELFPEKTNIEFIKILSKNEIIMNVWERGAGITLACGTGASAGVVVGIINGYLSNTVHVHLPGGDLLIEWYGEDVFMTGPSEKVFDGEIIIKEGK